MRNIWAFALLPLLVAGCQSPIRTATITGRVTDRDGLPVRDARVYTIDGETRTTSNGSYVLNNNRGDYLTVFAEYRTTGGTVYRGRNVVRAVTDQSQVSLNITIERTGLLAKLRGTVRDRNGVPLSGASVFAFTDSQLSSSRAVTDDFGNYSLEDLMAGFTYEVSAGGYGYSNDELTTTLSAGESRTVNFTLNDAGSPILPAPQNLSVITWVSPAQTRSPKTAAAYEAIKQMIDPQRAAKHSSSRASTNGNPIEVEINWDRLSGQDFYGYGIYRGIGLSGAITDYDFYREPMAGTYIDGDPNLLANATYRYQLTALGTLYPDDPDSEGPRSAVVQADTLNDLTGALATSGTNSVTVSWNGGSGATSYVVYIFDQFPGLGVTSILNNSSSPTTSNSLVFSNPGLQRGRQYYFLVLGLANSNRSRTLSEIGQFTY